MPPGCQATSTNLRLQSATRARQRRRARRLQVFWQRACWLTFILPTVARAQPISGDQSARAHFDAGLAAVERREFETAVLEFSAAYEQKPHRATLLALGQAHAALGHSVEAVDALERYLAEEGRSLTAGRKAQVQALLREHQRRIGTLELRVNVDGANMTLDGKRVGQSPLRDSLKAVRGTHSIVVQKEGTVPWIRSVQIEAQRTTRLDVTLVSLPSPQMAPALLSVTSPLLDVRVFVDGAARGSTPLKAPLLVTAGQHSVRCEREGYGATRHVITIGAGELQRTRCQPTRLAGPLANGAHLDIRVSVAGATVLVDGTAWSSSPIPAGLHDIVVTHAGYRTWRREVELPAAVRRILMVDLEPRDFLEFANAERLRERRRWAYGLGATGLLCGLSGGVMLWANSARYDRWQGERDATNAQLAEGTPSASLLGRNATLEDRVASVAWMDGLASGLALVGSAAIVAAVGAWVWGGEPSPLAEDVARSDVDRPSQPATPRRAAR